MMMRLPGVAASIMAGQELVVPRLFVCCQPGYLAQAHFKPRAIIWELFGESMGTISLQWPAISPEKD